MYNIIIEDEFNAHGSIVDLNVMFVPQVDIIVDKTEQFWFFVLHKQIKDKDGHYTLPNALIEHLRKISSNNVSYS